MSGLLEIEHMETAAVENMEAAADRDLELRMNSEERNRDLELRKNSEERNRKKRYLFLLLNALALAVGTSAGPLLTRFYFRHGGSRRWLSSWLETVGWPLLLPPLYLSYRKQPNREHHITPSLFLASCGIGILTGADDYLYAYGLSFLPVSTSAVLIATQLGFNAAFALLLVRQKFSPFSVNSVALLTASSVLLAFHTSNDRPEGVTKRQYAVGFILTLGAAALNPQLPYGVYLNTRWGLIELTYNTTKRQITYMLVMEMQFMMSFSATVFCTAGMLINGDFQALHREANEFRVGVFGVTSLGSSLLSGVIIAAMIPVTEVLAVVL